VKPGYGAKFQPAFEEAGIEDMDDVRKVREAEFADLETTLRSAGARAMHVTNIRDGISALAGPAVVEPPQGLGVAQVIAGLEMGLSYRGPVKVTAAAAGHADQSFVGQTGVVNDESHGDLKVAFPPREYSEEWYPASCLKKLERKDQHPEPEYSGKVVVVGDACDEDTTPTAQYRRQEGSVVAQKYEDFHVEFADGFDAWFPTAALVKVSQELSVDLGYRGPVKVVAADERVHTGEDFVGQHGTVIEESHGDLKVAFPARAFTEAWYPPICLQKQNGQTGAQNGQTGAQQTRASKTKSQYRHSTFEGHVVKSGWLAKRSSGLVKRWHQRFFTVCGHYLRYSLSSHDHGGQLKSAFDLRDMRSCEQSAREVRVVLRAQGEGRETTLTVQADEEASAAEWYAVLKGFQSSQGQSSGGASAAGKRGSAGAAGKQRPAGRSKPDVKPDATAQNAAAGESLFASGMKTADTAASTRQLRQKSLGKSGRGLLDQI
jgi:hypothetical protein